MRYGIILFTFLLVTQARAATVTYDYAGWNGEDPVYQWIVTKEYFDSWGDLPVKLQPISIAGPMWLKPVLVGWYIPIVPFKDPSGLDFSPTPVPTPFVLFYFVTGIVLIIGTAKRKLIRLW